MPGGPLAYRRRIRAFGPLLALVPPGLLGAGGLALLAGSTGVSRGAPGFLLCCLAAPALLLVGVPLTAGSSAYTTAVVLSVAVWLVVGVVAGRRATRRPASTWPAFWREYAWLAAAVLVGVVVALLATNLLLGRALL